MVRSNYAASGRSSFTSKYRDDDWDEDESIPESDPEPEVETIDLGNGRTIIRPVSRKRHDLKILHANTLSKAEERSYELQLGVRPMDRQDAERIMDDLNVRHVDRGERNWHSRREMSAWLKDQKPGERGELPGGRQKYRSHA